MRSRIGEHEAVSRIAVLAYEVEERGEVRRNRQMESRDSLSSPNERDLRECYHSNGASESLRWGPRLCMRAALIRFSRYDPPIKLVQPRHRAPTNSSPYRHTTAMSVGFGSSTHRDESETHRGGIAAKRNADDPPTSPQPDPGYLVHA